MQLGTWPREEGLSMKVDLIRICLSPHRALMYGKEVVIRQTAR